MNNKSQIYNFDSSHLWQNGIKQTFYPPLLRSGGLAARATVVTSQTKAGRNLVKDVDIVKRSAESVLARTPGIDGDVGERVHAHGFARRQSAVDKETILAVLGVCVVLTTTLLLLGGHTSAILVDLVVFTVVGGGANTTSNGVAGLPVNGEVGAGAVADSGILGVLGKARLFVSTDGVALVALIFGLGKVLGVGRAPNARFAC